MEEEQLNRTAQLLSNTAIEDAMDELLMEEMDKDLDQGVDDIVELTIKQSIRSIRDGRASPTDKMMGKLLKSLATITAPEGLDPVATSQLTKTSGKRSGLRRLLDRLFKRNKKEVEDVDRALSGGSSGSPTEKKKNPPKCKKTRDWIRKHVCCFIRQSD
ncbi:uncharacterized protein LOC117322832 [Pecten maximus]|uniref:uncharacterized protein LOC117322832 n=1 Tax=Pecten maximus TaxID=6579 RepID=UPI00145914C0|nr:uncharacterized protein LOC117322832 [Pecten maximus]